MENMTTKITSSYNNALDIKVVDGHFATNHSHINRYIDMTTIKSRRKMALAAAKSMATEYVATTIVDTIVCMDGTEVIGAYLANALTEYDLYASGTVTREVAMTYAQDQQYLRKKINGQ